MRAQLAVVTVVDGDEGIDTGLAGRVELGQLQFALIGRQRPEAEALQSDRGLAEIDQLDSGHAFQETFRSFHHAGDAISIETSDATTDYRLDVPVGPGADAGLDEEQASTLASHGVGALAAIGGAASHTWRLEQYA